MTCDLVALRLEAGDPARLAGFWAGLLGREPHPGRDDGVMLVPADDTGLRLHVVPGGAPRAGRHRMHLDLTSASPQDQAERVATALALGARHLDVGQRPEEGHVVLADPEGNELCVIAAGNGFLAGCGLVGAVSCDGSQQVGYFWSEALGWPLVWDQKQETAIQSPYGGPKITWGGPPVMPKPGRNRLLLEVAPSAGGDQRAEVDRLVSLGARVLEPDPDLIGREGGAVLMADPDDNELLVLPAPLAEGPAGVSGT